MGTRSYFRERMNMEMYFIVIFCLLCLLKHSEGSIQNTMAAYVDERGMLLKRSGEMSSLKYTNGTYKINFDVAGVNWRNRGSPIVQITVVNHHHFRSNPQFELDLVSTDSTPQTVVITEANKKFIRYCVLDGNGVPVDSETHVLIVWV